MNLILTHGFICVASCVLRWEYLSLIFVARNQAWFRCFLPKGRVVLQNHCSGNCLEFRANQLKHRVNQLCTVNDLRPTTFLQMSLQILWSLEGAVWFATSDFCYRNILLISRAHKTDSCQIFPFLYVQKYRCACTSPASFLPGATPIIEVGPHTTSSISS